jgi:hypothetical protein
MPGWWLGSTRGGGTAWRERRRASRLATPYLWQGSLSYKNSAARAQQQTEHDGDATGFLHTEPAFTAFQSVYILPASVHWAAASAGTDEDCQKDGVVVWHALRSAAKGPELTPYATLMGCAAMPF